MAFAKPAFAERRSHARSKVAVPGRLLLANRRELACTIVDVSPGGLALLAREPGAIGEPIVVYVEGIGRVQGEVVRHFDGGFAIRLVGNSRAADVLAQRFG
jgi:hypothetical protein